MNNLLEESFFYQPPKVISPHLCNNFLNNDPYDVIDNSNRFVPYTSFSATAFEDLLIKGGKISVEKKNDFYILNNLGLRCDNIKPDQDYDFLFIGDSFAFGEGLPYKKNWSGMLYDKLGSTKSFICLGYPGASIDFILERAEFFIQKYKKPKSVFALFPSTSRKKILINNEEIVCIPQNSDQEQINKIWGNTNRFSYYDNKIKMFSKFLFSQNINFIWSLWDNADLPVFSKKPRPGFVGVEDKKIKKYSDPMESETSEYYERARDMVHPGIMYSSAIANIFREKYVSQNNK